MNRHFTLLPIILFFLIGLIALRLIHDPDNGLNLAKQSRTTDENIPGTGANQIVITRVDASTRLIKHVAGESHVKLQPRRIVALGWLDELCAIGIKPVAALVDRHNAFPDYLSDYSNGIIKLYGNAGAPDLEAISAAQPDLILCTWWWLPFWDSLEEIAPTIILQPAHWQWEQRLRDVGLACNQNTAAENAILKCRRELNRAAQTIAHHEPDQSVVLLRVYAREFRIYGFGYSGPLLYGDLHLPKPSFVQNHVWERDVIRLSLEGLRQVDADIILLMTEDHLPVSQLIEQHLKRHPLWNTLPAVKNNKIIPVQNQVMRGGVIGRSKMANLIAMQIADL